MSRGKSKTITIKLLAEETGYSIGTVSSVLTNQHSARRISLKTVQEIRKAAQRNGYVPNIAARRLRSDDANNRSVAIITSYEAPLTLTSYAVHSLRRLIDSKKSALATYTTIIEMFHFGRLSEMAGLLSMSHFNAAIITNTSREDDAYLDSVFIPYPVVVVNRDLLSYPSVCEHPETGRKTASIFLGQGRRKLGILYPKQLTQSTWNRVNAYSRTTVELTGNQPVKIVSNDLSELSSSEAVAHFIRSKNPIDALYCVSDSLAFGAYHAIKRAKLSIPQDISIIGVGDSEFHPYLDPPLSTVGVSHEKLHDRVAQVLIETLNCTPQEKTSLKIEPEIHLRESCIENP